VCVNFVKEFDVRSLEVSFDSEKFSDCFHCCDVATMLHSENER